MAFCYLQERSAASHHAFLDVVWHATPFSSGRHLLDQAKFHTYTKIGLYMNLGAQPDRARPSQAKDLIDTEDNIYVRCNL